jgi:hypothetical protein
MRVAVKDGGYRITIKRFLKSARTQERKDLRGFADDVASIGE